MCVWKRAREWESVCVSVCVCARVVCVCVCVWKQKVVLHFLSRTHLHTDTHKHMLYTRSLSRLISYTSVLFISFPWGEREREIDTDTDTDHGRDSDTREAETFKRNRDKRIPCTLPGPGALVPPVACSWQDSLYCISAIYSSHVLLYHTWTQFTLY